MSPKRLLTIAVISMLAAVACAQSSSESLSSPTEIILGTTSPDLLLMRGDVRDDLQLSTEQSIKILTIQNSFQDESEKIAPATSESDDGSATSYDALRKYTIEQVDQVLSADQMKRLKQIALQLTGYSALGRSDVQKQVDLSKDLQVKIYDLVNEEHEADDSVMAKYQSGDLAAEQFPEIIKKNRQVLNAEIGKILPDSVKDKFKTLGGRPFKATPTL